MQALLAKETTSPFEAARRAAMAEATGNGPADWAWAMAAVATRADRDAFMRIYDHFMPRLCLYLRGVGAPDSVAEDLAQEALLRLWQHAAGYDPARSALSTWLFRIARNLHIDRLRREAIRPQPAHDPVRGETESPGECVDDGCPVEDHADHACLLRHIDALPAIQARLLRMSYFEAKSHQEISAELNMPLGTVKSHLRRAFLRLQGELGDNA